MEARYSPLHRLSPPLLHTWASPVLQYALRSYFGAEQAQPSLSVSVRCLADGVLVLQSYGSQSRIARYAASWRAQPEAKFDQITAQLEELTDSAWQLAQGSHPTLRFGATRSVQRCTGEQGLL